MSSGDYPTFDLGALFADDETVTRFIRPPSPEHPKGVYVAMKRRLSYGEIAKVQATLWRGQVRDDGEGAVGGNAVLSDWERFRLVSLAMRITDWNLPGRDGKMVRWPVSLADRIRVVGSLAEPVGNWLDQQVRELAEADGAPLTADHTDDEAVSADPLDRPANVVELDRTST